MRTPTRPRSAGPLFLVALVAVIVAACGAGAAPQLGPVGQDGGDTGYGGAPTGAPAEAPDGGGEKRVFDAARPDLLIIKTGSMELQVDVVDEAVDDATAAIVGLGGYVSGSEQAGQDDELVATLTFRIPAEAWEDALSALRGLALKVLAERTGTQDVTGEVVDLRARIKNLQATEAALQSIMAQAVKISDVLAVQAELTKVRGEIESLTAQRQHLEEQAAFSTLSVRFSREPEAAVVTSQKKFDPQSEVDRATANLVEVIQSLATAGIWFAIVWLPILLVLGIVAAIVLVIARRRRRAAAGAMGSTGEAPGLPPVDPAAG